MQRLCNHSLSEYPARDLNSQEQSSLGPEPNALPTELYPRTCDYNTIYQKKLQFEIGRKMQDVKLRYLSCVRTVPAGIERVTQVFPPIVQPLPITVSPPRIVAPA